MTTVFLAKPRKTIEKTKTLFNEVVLYVTTHKKVRMTEQKYSLALETPTTQKSFRNQCALVQYIAINFRSDICTTLQLIAPGNFNVEEKQ